MESPRRAQRADDVRSDRDRGLPDPGFLTPLAALSAAAFLAMIYFSMPPWPGLPPNPKAEGHYLIVSKNLVELIACLVIATTPSGHWIGFDALFFGARRRRRLAARAAAEQELGSRQYGSTQFGQTLRGLSRRSSASQLNNEQLTTDN